MRFNKLNQLWGARLLAMLFAALLLAGCGGSSSSSSSGGIDKLPLTSPKAVSVTGSVCQWHYTIQSLPWQC